MPCTLLRRPGCRGQGLPCPALPLLAPRTDSPLPLHPLSWPRVSLLPQTRGQGRPWPEDCAVQLVSSPCPPGLSPEPRGACPDRKQSPQGRLTPHRVQAQSRPCHLASIPPTSLSWGLAPSSHPTPAPEASSQPLLLGALTPPQGEPLTSDLSRAQSRTGELLCFCAVLADG